MVRDMLPSQGSQELAFVWWSRHLFDGTDLWWIWVGSALIINTSKELDRAALDFTLLLVQYQSLFSCDLNELVLSPDMFCIILNVYDDKSITHVCGMLSEEMIYI